MTKVLSNDVIIKLRNFFSKFPTIELGNVRLRDIRLSDQKDYYDYLNEPAVNCYLSDEDIPTSEEEALECVKMWGSLFYKKHAIFWAIADSETDQLIGTIGFTSWNFYNGRAEISYDISEKYWGKGIATKSLSAILQIGFKDMLLYKIEAKTMQDNSVSQHILGKFGFKKEGVLRGYRKIREKHEDICVYGLIKSEYPDFLLT